MASKNKKYKTSFSDGFTETFSFITKCLSHIPDHQHKFHCTVYNANISLAHGGSNGIKKHQDTPRHKKLAAAAEGMILI